MRLPISLAMTIRGIVSELFFEFLFFRGSNQRLAVSNWQWAKASERLNVENRPSPG
jgi:hypothetical protein